MRQRLSFAETAPGVHDALVEVPETGPALLRIGGVATAYDVSVDGEVVLTETSMFAQHAIALELASGRHRVRIACRDLGELLDEVPRRPRPRWRTALVDDQRLRWVRTSLLGHCPGLRTGPPVVGPWRPVLLDHGPGPLIASLDLTTVLEDGDAVVELRAGVVDADPRSVDAVLDTPSGPLAVALDAEGAGRLVVPGAQVWWPHTHGTPALHDLRLRHDGVALDLPGDGTSADQTRWRVGFRTLANTSTDALALALNDVEVFCRGAVWTPGDLGALGEAVGLGMNMVRVPGWAHYESDAFHERCAELGLLVWQDLAFANLDVPIAADPDFAAQVDAEVAQECTRLRRHPSTAVVCGSSDTEQQAAMFGLVAGDPARHELAAHLAPQVAASGLDAIWVDSAPTGGDLPFRPSTGVATYFGVGAYRRPPSDARTSGVRFAAECLAFAQVPDDAVGDLGSAAWKEGVQRDQGATWDFDDVREHYLRERYGDAAMADLDLHRLVTGEVMAAAFGEWRRADSPCAGALVLWLRDLVPGAGWGLLDHGGRTKSAARVLAPVLAPVAIWLLDEGLGGLDVHLANDTASPMAGRLEIRLERADGSVVIDAATEVVVPPRGQCRTGVEEVLGRFVDASAAYAFGARAHDRAVAILHLDAASASAAGGGPTRTAAWVADPATSPQLGPLECLRPLEPPGDRT